MAGAQVYEFPQNPEPRPRSLACEHVQVSGVVSASCGICGPIPEVATA